MTINNEKLTNALKGGFVQSAREVKMGQAEVENLGKLIVEKFINQGKKFGTTDVANLIKTEKIADYSKCKDPEAARKTAARKALISLGVIPAPQKKDTAKNEQK